MSVIPLDAKDLGTVLACAMAAVTTEGHLRPAEQTRLGLSIAQSLAEVSKLNRKTFATLYGEIPPAAVSASDITQAAAQVDPFEEPDRCSSGHGERATSAASHVAYNTDLRKHAKLAAQLDGLHEAMTDFARKQGELVARAKYAAAQGLKLAQVESGRYPWIQAYTSADGKRYTRETGNFNKAMASALKEATGRTWSVKGSRGSSWVRVDAPPARQVCEWDGVTAAPKGQGYSCMDDRRVLGRAMGTPGGVVHAQGVQIEPGGGCYERAYDIVKKRPDLPACQRNWD